MATQSHNPSLRGREAERIYASSGQQYSSVHGMADFTETRRVGPVELEIRPNPELWKGALAGAVAGLVASTVMTRFQGLWSSAQQKLKSNSSQQQTPRHSEPSSNPTVKVADNIIRKVAGKEVPRQHKETAGTIVHYGFGTAMGAVYGLLTEVSPSATAGYGLAYGAALFIGADELAVPALDLSRPATEVPLNRHLYGLASHLVYAAALEGTRRLARRGMEHI